MKECDACQFKDDPNNTCWCVLNNTPQICQYLMGNRGDEETRQAYRRLVYVRTTGKEPEGESPIVHGSNKLVSLGTDDPKRLQMRTEARIANLRLQVARVCTFRGEKIGTGCACQFPCALGHGEFEHGIVTTAGCLQCVQGNPPRVTSAQSTAEPPTPTPLELHHLSE